MKRCNTCGETKPDEAYDRHRRNPGGYVSRCKSCGLAARRALASTAAVVSKFCPRCEQTKDAAEFQKNRTTRDGLQAYCKGCSGDIQREYQARNADLIALRRAQKLLEPIGADKTKVCKRCQRKKPLLEFYAHRGTKDRRGIYCKECSREYDRQRRAKDHEGYRESLKAWRAANPEMKKQAMRNWRLKVYGLTADDYLEMYAAQRGRCRVCGTTGETFGGRRLHIDHDHTTNKVRGLLCGLCNAGIGMLKDSPELLRTAASYIEAAAVP